MDLVHRLLSRHHHDIFFIIAAEAARRCRWGAARRRGAPSAEEASVAKNTNFPNKNEYLRVVRRGAPVSKIASPPSCSDSMKGFEKVEKNILRDAMKEKISEIEFSS